MTVSNDYQIPSDKIRITIPYEDYLYKSIRTGFGLGFSISSFFSFSSIPFVGFSPFSGLTIIGATLLVGFAVPLTAAVGLGIPLPLRREDSFMFGLSSFEGNS